MTLEPFCVGGVKFQRQWTGSKEAVNGNPPPFSRSPAPSLLTPTPIFLPHTFGFSPSSTLPMAALSSPFNRLISSFKLAIVVGELLAGQAAGRPPLPQREVFLGNGTVKNWRLQSFGGNL